MELSPMRLAVHEGAEGNPRPPCASAVPQGSFVCRSFGSFSHRIASAIFDFDSFSVRPNRLQGYWMSATGSETPPVLGIFGMGRSGTTWLGSIMNSHPGITYRFEATNRLSDHPRMKEINEALERGDRSFTEILYRNLLPLHPMLDKAPFFKKDHSPLLMRQQLWVFCRAVKPFGALYEALYTPKYGTALAFKEINGDRLMRYLLKQTSIKILYIVRSPWAVVASTMRGQAEHLMPTGRFDVLDSLLEKHDENLANHYAGKIDSLNDIQKNALLWRMDAEKGVTAIDGNPHAMLMIYENLCRAPLEQSKEAFSHFGMDMHTNTEDFISASSSSEGSARREHGEAVVNDYFSVFRDPMQSMNKWKTQLTEQEQAEITEVVGDSEVFQRCASLGHWV
jgi:hypothetical protein